MWQLLEAVIETTAIGRLCLDVASDIPPPPPKKNYILNKHVPMALNIIIEHNFKHSINLTNKKRL